MKKLVAVQEVTGEGYEALMGEQVALFCMNYIYTGTLIGVNERVLLLEKASIVYETGKFQDEAWKDAQSLVTAKNPDGKWYVSISAVESFGLLK